MTGPFTRWLPTLLPLVLLLGACRGDRLTGVEAPGTPLGTIGDATLAGQNPYFYLLPPAVKGAPTIPAGYTFNSGLLPVVSVCPAAQETTVCENPVKSYKGSTGAVREVTADKLYQLDWNTEDVPVGKYRIFVGVPGLTLGYFDVETLAKGSGSAKRNNDDVVLKDGRMFPIKFYIATGAVSYELHQSNSSFPICSAAVDCVVQSVSGSATDTTNVVTSEGRAAVALPPGWFANSGFEVVTVAIVRNSGPCLPPASAATPYTDQVPGCYSYATVPQLTNGFDEQVRVEVCLDSNADIEQYDLWKFSSFGPEAGLTQPSPVGDRLIDCSGFGSQLAIANRPLLRWAAAGWSRIARAIGPKSLYARDTGAGGLVGSFSEIGWARTRELTALSGGGQTGSAFTQVANPVSVRVTSGHGSGATALPGIPVTFQIVSGDGSFPNKATTMMVTTDSAGTAAAGWVLGGAGPQTLIAFTAWSDTVTFNATATAAPGLVSRWPLDGNVADAQGPNDGTLSGTTEFVAGIIGQGLAFFGPSSPAQMNASGTGIDQATRVTLATWVKLGANNAGTGIQRFVTLGNEKAVLRLDQSYEPNGTINSLHFYAINGSGTGAYAPGVLSQRDCFYHVAGTYDGSDIRLYLNGILQATQPYTAGLGTGNGVVFSSTGEMLDGVLDDVHIYDRALSDNEIAALATTSSTAVCVNQVVIR